MDFITINQDNIDSEHICCSITEKKGETAISSKKAWMKERFEDGLTFVRMNVRGKVFIEYIPAEKAWYPISANNYMHINCFWIAGQYKGKGYANELLNHCIKDALAKGKCGITVIASEKKRGFLSDPNYLKYKGFQAIDTAHPYFILYYLPFSDDAPIPCFNDCVKQDEIDEKGMVLYYTNQCPFTDKYVPIISEIAKQHGTTISLHKIETLIQAQNCPSPFTTYSFYFEGKFITNEIFSDKKFEKFLLEHHL